MQCKFTDLLKNLDKVYNLVEVQRDFHIFEQPILMTKKHTLPLKVNTYYHIYSRGIN